MAVTRLFAAAEVLVLSPSPSDSLPSKHTFELFTRSTVNIWSFK